MIEKERIRILNGGEIFKGAYILYWMQASVRANFNPALEYAISEANRRNLPLVALFCLISDYPAANYRSYKFLLEGLAETQRTLARRGIPLIIRLSSPENEILKMAKKAEITIFDAGYTHIQKNWRNFLAPRLDCPVIQVESNTVVPVNLASAKEEYSAATFRPKIMKYLDFFLKLPPRGEIRKQSAPEFESVNIDDTEKILGQISPNPSVARSSLFTGGTGEAVKRLDYFIEKNLDKYEDFRNDPAAEATSNLSPYLHFGQISPVYAALRVLEAGGNKAYEFLDQLIVRRELAFNFVNYNKIYDSFASLPRWCRQTLEDHRADERDYIYSLEDFENSRTHDPYWNAAQTEMVKTGKMHGYMRMYWGKKILQWSKTPEEAYKTAIFLNDKYELDGRDPNGYAGIAWCFGKHDRPWKPREIFGSIRYMNDKGLKRKFDIDAYAARVSRY